MGRDHRGWNVVMVSPCPSEPNAIYRIKIGSRVLEVPTPGAPMLIYVNPTPGSFDVWKRHQYLARDSWLARHRGWSRSTEDWGNGAGKFVPCDNLWGRAGAWQRKKWAAQSKKLAARRLAARAQRARL